VLKKIDGKIGNVEIAIVLDSYLLGETAQSWFPLFDRKAIRQHEYWLCPRHYDPETGRIPMPVQTFVLRTEHYVILVDTCIGSHKERPGVSEMHRLTTRYLDRLAAVGLAPEDVDFVMCTHLHVDHVGWNTRLLDGRWVPTFPNAQYVMSQLEFDATRDLAKKPDVLAAIRNCFEDSVLPIIEAGKAIFVNGIHEMLDGFTLRPAPGHSPGHIRIEMRSGNELGVFAGDLVHSPIQIPFWKWSTRVCTNGEQAANTRRELLEFCVEENALLLPCHFEAPHVARIRDNHGQFSANFGWEK
jgi:glyoxylase-like metal-dependent hydrolase (beta-lactamase superfamily II)